jgi:DNA-binding XRE family transcriptional regulator
MKTKMKEYRNRLGFTQEKLAEIVGVRRETIIFLEQGKYNQIGRASCRERVSSPV